MNAPFGNIRFVNNAVARWNRHHYDHVGTSGTISISHASSVTSASLASAGSLFGGFDGPFVAVLPEAVHSPRLDDVHDRKRGKVHLRRRDRRAGLCAIPDHRRRTQG